METNIGKTTITDLNSTINDYSVKAAHTDGVSVVGETYYDNENFAERYGYFKSIPEYKQALIALATWAIGKGFNADARTIVELGNLTGNGKDTFDSIMMNLFITALFHGDSYAEIVRDKSRLINIKPLDPQSMRTVFDDKGRIIRYEQRTKTSNNITKWKPHEIFHLMIDRIADETHGTAVIESCKWVIDTRNEAMTDWRRVLHRSTVRVLYIDADDTSRLQQVKTEYREAIKYGELIILPAKKGDAEFEQLEAPDVNKFLQWIQYLENVFYQIVGVPRVIATSENFTEAGSKVGYATFEPTYTRHQTYLEKQIWLQLGYKITFNRPPSLMENMQSDETKNAGQLGFQPNDTQIGRGKA